MWLACCTQDEIAEAVGYSRQEVTKQMTSFATDGNLSVCSKTHQLAADHAVDFEPPTKKACPRLTVLAQARLATREPQ